MLFTTEQNKKSVTVIYTGPVCLAHCEQCANSVSEATVETCVVCVVFKHSVRVDCGFTNIV